jgi:hypothetical protein
MTRASFKVFHRPLSTLVVFRNGDRLSFPNSILQTNPEAVDEALQASGSNLGEIRAYTSLDTSSAA